MTFFPFQPVPSSVSAPAILDPMWSFEADAGITIRRAKHSRPRRRFSLDYLGKTTTEMRMVRDFLQEQRLGALSFQWAHPTALDFVNVDGTTTPVAIIYEHGLVTGQWVGLVNGPPSLQALWQVTRINRQVLVLNGSVATGTVATAFAFVYLPTAVGVFSGDVMASPEKILGPEQWYPVGAQNRIGYFNFQVFIEEIF